MNPHQSQDPSNQTVNLPLAAEPSNDYLKIKEATAPKLGKQAQGAIAYQLHADQSRTELFVSIVRNAGGGYFSRELVPFTSIETCVSTGAKGAPFSSKLLAGAFRGKSSNNGGFLAAILRSEGLIAAAPEAETQHVLSGDWASWKAECLGNLGDGTASSDDPGKPAKRKTLTLKRGGSGDGSSAPQAGAPT